jgi:hypothetical protein
MVIGEEETALEVGYGSAVESALPILILVLSGPVLGRVQDACSRPEATTVTAMTKTELHRLVDALATSPLRCGSPSASR